MTSDNPICHQGGSNAIMAGMTIGQNSGNMVEKNVNPLSGSRIAWNMI